LFCPDSIKGFSKETIKQIYQENEAVILEKNDIHNAEVNAETVWLMYHYEMIHKMKKTKEQIQRRIVKEQSLQCTMQEK
jgi:hypothetical protein